MGGLDPFFFKLRIADLRQQLLSIRNPPLRNRHSCLRLFHFRFRDTAFCLALNCLSPSDSPSFSSVGTAAGTEGLLSRGEAPRLPVICDESSAKNLFAALRRPRVAGVCSFASSVLSFALRSSPICCPRLRAGAPAFACAFLLVAIRSPPEIKRRSPKTSNSRTKDLPSRRPTLPLPTLRLASRAASPT
jgi:hypothetical protein